MDRGTVEFVVSLSVPVLLWALPCQQAAAALKALRHARMEPGVTSELLADLMASSYEASKLAEEFSWYPVKPPSDSERAGHFQALWSTFGQRAAA